jgi:hypothetical protein
MSPDPAVESENPIAAAIDAAEDIHDPLEGIAEKTSADAGAPFAPDALERLALKSFLTSAPLLPSSMAGRHAIGPRPAPSPAAQPNG